MPLTVVQVRAAQPREKAFKLADGGGLFLHVALTGARVWRLRYSFGGKENTYTIGSVSDVTLVQAREARDRAKALLREGRDPGTARRIAKLIAVKQAGDTFELIARAWHAQNVGRWTPHHAKDVMTSLETDIFAGLGRIPIREITPPMVLAVLRPIEQRGAAETARRIRQRMSAVFVHAIASGLADTDPAAIVRGAMAPLPAKGRQPAITDLEEVRIILRAAENTPASPVVRLALRFLALTAVRPGELRAARWEEIDGAVWRIPSARMKMKRPHDVLLSRQALEVLDVARGFSGRGPVIFPNSRFAHRPLSENALGYLLNRAGYHSRHCPHGFRATFSTVMNERYPADRAIIDLMLAHAPRDRVEAAYNRATHMKRRAELAQAWADLLLEGAAPAETLRAKFVSG